MTVLNEQDRNQLENELEQVIGKHAFDVIEAAVLAKLAGMDLPEPVVIDRHIPTNILIRGHTPAQLHQAFAQGAASQLSASKGQITKLKRQIAASKGNV